MTDRPTNFAEAMANPIDRGIFADSLDIALDGGCGLCDTERDHMCAGCGRCNCHNHTTCVRPSTEQPIIEHTIHCETGPATVQARGYQAGLLVYRIPEHVDTGSPLRWRLGHYSGLLIAAAASEHEAHAGAYEIANQADWTGSAMEVRTAIVELADLYEDLALVGCHIPDHP